MLTFMSGGSHLLTACRCFHHYVDFFFFFQTGVLIYVLSQEFLSSLEVINPSPWTTFPGVVTPTVNWILLYPQSVIKKNAPTGMPI